MPGRQEYQIQSVTYTGWSANTTPTLAPDGLRGGQTVIPSSFSFTASSKLSRGGFGLLNFISNKSLNSKANVIGAYRVWNATDDTDVRQYTLQFPTAWSAVNSSAIYTALPNNLFNLYTVWDNSGFSWDNGTLTWADAWTNIPSSFSFTASSKLSRALSGGIIGFLYTKHQHTNASAGIGAYRNKSAILHVSGGGEVKEGTANITVTIQVGAGVLINGSASMTATGSLTGILAKEETGVPGTVAAVGTMTANANATVNIEAGMYGGIVTNNRFIEDPETIAGSMVLDGITAQFSDLYSGYYNRKLAWGYTSYPAANFKQPRSVLNVGYDWLPVNLNVYSVVEEDVTPESSDLDGITSWTTDFYSGYMANWIGTLDNLTYARNTQVVAEVLAQVSSNARLTQTAAEVLISPGSRARMTQTAVEVLRQINVGWIQQEAVETMGNQISALRYALIQQCALEVMYSIKAKVNMTQLATEMLKGPNPDPPVNLSHVATEVLRQKVELDSTPSLIQQVALESLRNAPNPTANINHMALEYIVQPFPPAVINHMAMEWVRNATVIPAVVNHMALEKMRNAVITPTYVQHIAIEILVRPEFDPTVSSLINNPKFYF